MTAKKACLNDSTLFVTCLCQDMPLGGALYPAVSVKGRAAFCFGNSVRSFSNIFVA